MQNVGIFKPFFLKPIKMASIPSIFTGFYGPLQASGAKAGRRRRPKACGFAAGLARFARGFCP
jgi:hypothetical protein